MISHLPCDCNKHKKKFETSWHFRLLIRTILMQTVTGLLLPSSSLWANQMQKKEEWDKSCQNKMGMLVPQGTW